ncbi:SOS response-associated peptidase family protein, partial [Acinetobacter baumannii]
AKDAKKAFKPLINARSETLMESRVFKQSFMRRRCIIPADSFYEWQRSETTKIPMRILLKGHGLFAFAGIYEEGRDAD